MAFSGAFVKPFRPAFDAGLAVPMLPCYYLSFDGTDYGTFASGVVAVPPLTIVAWVKPTTRNQQQVLGEGNYSGMFQFWSVVLCAWGGSSYGGTTTSNAWQHIAATIPASGAVRVFRNGTDVTTTVNNSDNGTRTITQIGRRFDGALKYTGLMSAIGIAPSVLDVASLYGAGTFHKPLVAATWTLLALNMRNESGAGTTVDDESANNKNVTLAASPNTPTWSGTMATGGPAGWSDT